MENYEATIAGLKETIKTLVEKIITIEGIPEFSNETEIVPKSKFFNYYTSMVIYNKNLAKKAHSGLFRQAVLNQMVAIEGIVTVVDSLRYMKSRYFSYAAIRDIIKEDMYKLLETYMGDYILLKATTKKVEKPKPQQQPRVTETEKPKPKPQQQPAQPQPPVVETEKPKAQPALPAAVKDAKPKMVSLGKCGYRIVADAADAEKRLNWACQSFGSNAVLEKLDFLKMVYRNKYRYPYVVRDYNYVLARRNLMEQMLA